MTHRRLGRRDQDAPTLARRRDQTNLSSRYLSKVQVRREVVRDGFRDSERRLMDLERQAGRGAGRRVSEESDAQEEEERRGAERGEETAGQAKRGREIREGVRE